MPDDPILVGMNLVDWARITQMGRASTLFAEMTRAMHAHPQPFGALLDETRRAGFGDLRALPEWAEFTRLGIGDVVSLKTIEPGTKGIIVCGLHPKYHRVDRRSIKLWSRVAAHISAARRLRAASPPVDDAEAVLTPSGRIDHAEVEGTTRTARDALRDAVVAPGARL